jgi:orotate phosphoribosyltransferase
MIFSDVEMALVRGKTVLLCEDVITTGGSVVRAAEAVLRAGGTALPFVCTMVNRSGLTEVDGRTIVQLIEQPMPTWQPGECPHCKLGSEAIRPKKPEINWAALNAVYA